MHTLSDRGSYLMAILQARWISSWSETQNANPHALSISRCPWTPAWRNTRHTIQTKLLTLLSLFWHLETWSRDTRQTGGIKMCIKNLHTGVRINQRSQSAAKAKHTSLQRRGGSDWGVAGCLFSVQMMNREHQSGMCLSNKAAHFCPPTSAPNLFWNWGILPLAS